MTAVASFREAFADALRGSQFHVVGLGDGPEPLPSARWAEPADADDLAMLELCTGPTLDIGCGPGRMSAALAQMGRIALGIDVVAEAVLQARNRGAAALLRDVFRSVPAEGRWNTALLADGNIGIGGDPAVLLSRTSALLTPRGSVVVELAEPGRASRTVWAELRGAGVRSKPFRWSVVGIDDIGPLAQVAGFHVDGVHQFGCRWTAVLTKVKEPA